MNAVIVAVLIMLILSLLRVNVVLALVAGAIAGGLAGGLSIDETITSFTDGLGAGATIALSYALLGGFAVAISKTGIPQLLVNAMLKIVKKDGQEDRTALGKVLIVLILSLTRYFFAEPNTDPHRFHSIISATNIAYLKPPESRSTFNRFCSNFWFNGPLYITSIWVRFYLPPNTCDPDGRSWSAD